MIVCKLIICTNYTIGTVSLKSEAVLFYYIETREKLNSFTIRN